jgi:FecR protein
MKSIIFESSVMVNNGSTMKFVFLFFFSVCVVSAYAETKVAMVKLIRGEADLLTLGKTTKLKIDDWVENGSVIRTADKSFVKLIFIDKSQMNVGPNSEMKIESYSDKDSGVIDLVRGKVRTQVTKDYLQIKDKDKSKLFIKTQNAVMGIRGTDFIISTNGINTSTVLFEGEIVFNKFERRGEYTTANLEEIVDRGVRLFPGEFSVMEADRTMPTVPALLNIQQREQLEKNADMTSDRSPGNSRAEPGKTVVPEGLTGQIVSSKNDTVKSEVSQFSKEDRRQPVAPSSSEPEGYVKGNMVKPANGCFVHIDSGVIIPPGPTAVLDGNTNTYIPGPETGIVSSDGSYVPPKNVEITNDGKILIAIYDPNGTVVVKELPPPPPVVAPSPVMLAPGTTSPIGPAPIPLPVATSPTTRPQPSGDIPLPGTGTFDPRFAPTGGIINVFDPTRQSTLIDATITVKPN